MSEEKILNSDVDTEWKKTFLMIEKCFEDGIIWKQKKIYFELKDDEKKEIKACIYRPLSSLCALIFGPLYYLLKGLWLKAIIYTIILVLIALMIKVAFNFNLGLFGMLLFVIFAPFDYYRLKVLDKQW